VDGGWSQEAMGGSMRHVRMRQPGRRARSKSEGQ
jgi:hypothetical protein